MNVHMNNRPDEVVIVIDRYRPRQNAFSVIGKKNIVVSVESHYSRRKGPVSVLKSAEQRAVPGCQFYVPWAETITGLTVNVYSIQDRLTCFVGQADITTEFCGIEPSKLDLYIKNCEETVGKIYLSVFVRQIFLDKSSPIEPACTAERLAMKRKEEGRGCDISSLCVSIPTPAEFRFNRLTRPINWERLRCINLRR